MFFADLQGVPEGVRQRVPAAAAHDLPRRVRRPQEVQVRRLRKGFQVQAPPQGNSPHILTVLTLFLLNSVN